MPKGTPITEQVRYAIIDMNAQRDLDGHCRFTMNEIAIAVGVSHRTVAITLREHSAAARVREKEAERVYRLTEPK